MILINKQTKNVINKFKFIKSNQLYKKPKEEGGAMAILYELLLCNILVDGNYFRKRMYLCGRMRCVLEVNNNDDKMDDLVLEFNSKYWYIIIFLYLTPQIKKMRSPDLLS